ncbi:MAG: glycosyltransferase family 2 protein [Ruminococcus sp.]|nr:glycosyltransferase family 2 protein [Ruminococcus sp.]
MDACVDSVRNQTYSNLEIILVDDGSPDSCGEKCDSLAEADSRIKVIHQENRGLSGARNSGLKVCRGEYVLYVDSDDTIAEDMVEHLFKIINETSSDVAVSTFRFTKGDNISSKRLTGEVFSGTAEEMLRLVTENGLWQAWGKLIKTEIAKSTSFAERMIYEDYENTPRLFLNSQKAVVSMDGRYNYTVRDDSIMGERQKETSVDFAKITERNLTLYENSGFSDDNKQYMYKFLFNQLVYNYNTTIKLSSNKKNDFIILTRKILKNNKSKWNKNYYISFGTKRAYSLICNLPFIYNAVYKLVRK